MARKPSRPGPHDARKRKRKTRRFGDASRFRGSAPKAEEIEYKNIALLQRLTSAQGKLFSRKRSGLNAPSQRRAALAVKRARFLALLPYAS